MGRRKDVAAFILAGGKSTRMGRDKAFVNIDGRPLLQHALELARSVTADVRIVGSNEKFSAYAPIVEDVFRDCGPLGGIHAALRASTTELSLILAVDMPFVTTEFLQYLIDVASESREAAVTVPRTDHGMQPLCAVYRREFAHEAEKALHAGRYKIDPLFNQVTTRVIQPEELQARGFSDCLFRNLNAPEDISRPETRAGLTI
jgi:molybdenum cofactor guanylyltransferase